MKKENPMEEIITKYCPNCLSKCTKSPYDDIGFGCEKCEVLLYSNTVLLDNPNEIEKSHEYKLNEMTGSLNLTRDIQEKLISNI